MDDRELWVLRQNIARFERLLANEKDAERRRWIERLLAEAKLGATEIESRSPTRV
jgi:hypothetical protein